MVMLLYNVRFRGKDGSIEVLIINIDK